MTTRRRRIAPPPRSRKLVALSALLLLALSALAVPSSAPAGLPPSTVATASHPEPSDFQTSANGNFSIWIPPPALAPVAGASVMAQFEVTLVSAPPAGGVLSVWVPQVEGSFFFENSTIHLYRAPFELNFSAGSSSTSPLMNASTVLRVGLPFNQSNFAILSSQLAAVMANAPYGSVHLALTWHWILIAPDGSNTTGTWSRPYPVVPAEYAELASSGPSVVHPGDAFGVCVAGAIGGRTFSLHIETANPYDDFSQVNQSAPAGSAGPMCWTAQVATWVSPQVLLAHVWSYDKVTLLLYILKVTVVNVTATLFGLPAYWTSATGVASLGSILLGVGVVAWGFGRWRIRRRPPRASDLPSSS
jgi:hypothetical protein